MTTDEQDQGKATDNLAGRQPDERSGQAGVATPPGAGPSSTDAPVVPDDEHPEIPAGAVPPGGPAESPQDIIREEGGQDRPAADVDVNVEQEAPPAG